jgi:hypothetical protein
MTAYERAQRSLWWAWRKHEFGPRPGLTPIHLLETPAERNQREQRQRELAEKGKRP